ncbi:ABC transporter permease [Streptomyces anulatus]|uniref:ABC transporter permease n=1 Tax=Streptomyces anulatus TaxID=1892 RepID=UPI0033E2A5E9|nr:ABC transporter permease [Streptomyces anulatus]WSU93470.1 ABC transporter permease [Streptomyces anulatus]WSW81574.1 ABC transporter permease [Streptomyces anulatus]
MTMTLTAVLHSEWIKIRSIRSIYGSLMAVLATTLTITVLILGTSGQEQAARAGSDVLLNTFFALNFGQIAAIAFGATAVSSEFVNGALRISLAAVPRRSLFYAAKMAAIGGSALAVGLVTTFTTFLVGQLFLGEHAIGLGHPGALRAAFGGGIYLALMALLAAGLAALLRSAVAVLSLLIPLFLIVPFVLVDVATAVVRYLPDRAGQAVLQQNPEDGLGPWTGLAVTAVWAAAALLAGWWAVRNRDA